MTGEVEVFAANAGDPDAAAACVDATLERFGGLDILVNNAATNPYMGQAIDIDLPRLDKTFQVNLRGPFVWTQLAWKAAHEGARRRRDQHGLDRRHDLRATIGVYDITKAALIHLTKHLATELGPNVRVNAIGAGSGEDRLGPRAVGARSEATQWPWPAAPPGRAGGHRQRRALPGERPGIVDHRPHPGRRRGRTPWGEGRMKELVYHRQLLPAVERSATRSAVVDTATSTATFERAPRPRAAPRQRPPHELGVRRGRPLRGHGAQQPPLPRAVPRRVPRARASSTRSTCGSRPRSWSSSSTTRAPRSCFVDCAVRRRSSTRCGARPARRAGRADRRRRRARTTCKYEDLLAAGEPVVPDEPEEDDPVVLMYTGGTTGPAEGRAARPAGRDAQPLPRRAWPSALERGPRRTCTRRRCSTPRRWARILGVPAPARRPVFVPAVRARAVLDAHRGARASTMTVMVPTMIGMLLAHPDFKPERLASLKTLTYGASPMPSALLERLLASCSPSSSSPRATA